MPPRHISVSEVGRRNLVDSDANEIAIKNGLKTTEAGLLRLRTLRSNAAPRCQLEDHIRGCQVAFALFKKIPNEIWMYIFELYCQSGQPSTCNTEWDSPVVLTHVCSAWRQIALSMPKLWSDVYFCNDVNLARMWLERAGNIPRALEISPWSYRPSFNWPQTIQSFVCSFPFRKLHITQWDAAIIDFTAIPVESLLLLEDLALLKPAWGFPHLEIKSLSHHRFPNLVSLHIDTDTMPRFHVSRPFATWKKLRVLRLECKLDKSKCLEILRDAPSIEDCSLCLSPVPFTHGQGSIIKNVTDTNWKVFKISLSSTSSLWPFLDHFRFPNLHTLIVTSDVGPTTTNFRPHDKSLLFRLALRIGSLRSLNLQNSYMNVDVGFVLECLPLLQFLKLHGAQITTHTVEKIGRGGLGGCLRELHDLSTNNLYGFLQACELRFDVTKHQSPNSSGAVARLEKVSVGHCKDYMVIDCEERIRKLCKDGIQFKVY